MPSSRNQPPTDPPELPELINQFDSTKPLDDWLTDDLLDWDIGDMPDGGSALRVVLIHQALMCHRALMSYWNGDSTMTSQEVFEEIIVSGIFVEQPNEPEEPKPDEPKPDEPKPDEPKPDEPKPDEPETDSDSPLQLSLPPYLDTSADLSSLHYPRVDGQPWFQNTLHHFMTSLKLTPCARLLWEWVLLKGPAGTLIEVDLHDFRAVTTEHRRGKPYSMRQIRNAVNELEELQLVIIKSESLRMLARHPGPVVNRKQKSEQREINFQARKLTSTSRKLTSVSKVETLVQTELQFPSDLDQIYSDLSSPLPPQGEPTEREREEVKEECGVGVTDQDQLVSEENPSFAETLEQNPAQPVDQGEGNYSAARVGFSKNTPQPLKRRQSGKEVWEIAPGQPHPDFVAWRAQHYLAQGGHLAATAKANAASEIRNNPARAADLWVEYSEYNQRAASNALAVKASAKPLEPTCMPEKETEISLAELVERKRSMWKNVPPLRDKIKAWVEATPEVELGEDGPQHIGQSDNWGCT